MIHLFTDTDAERLKLRDQFQDNRFKLSVPTGGDRVDLLSCLEAVKDMPQYFSLFGLKIHISEVFKPYLDWASGYSPITYREDIGATSIDFPAMMSWLSDVPVEDRQITRPDIISNFHGFISCNATRLMDRFYIALQKRLGKPVFIVAPSPLHKMNYLEYRFSVGFSDFSSVLSHYMANQNISFPSKQGHEDAKSKAHNVCLILNEAEIDDLRLGSGSNYMVHLLRFLQSLESRSVKKLTLMTEFSNSKTAQIRQKDFCDYCSAHMGGVAVSHISARSSEDMIQALREAQSIVSLSAYSSSQIAYKIQRNIYTLCESPWDIFGTTRPANLNSDILPQSLALDVDQVRRYEFVLKWAQENYFFQSSKMAKPYFDAIIRSVVTYGVPQF